MIHVECEDPRVLAEHQKVAEALGPACVRVEWTSALQGKWVRSVMGYGYPEHFAQGLADGKSYRLVFPDAEAAGKGLVEYAQRLGATVQYRSTWKPEPGGWVSLDVGRQPRTVADLFATGECRIAAPAEEPRPEPDTACACVPDVHDERGCPADTRPALPRGVQPVAWSDSEQAWVINGREVPRDWEWSTGFGSGWRNDDEAWLRLWLVLARPVPAPPEPETERVPWWEALGRDLPQPIKGERKIQEVRHCEGEAPQVGVHDPERHDRTQPYATGTSWVDVAADGTVEVLKAAT